MIVTYGTSGPKGLLCIILFYCEHSFYTATSAAAAVSTTAL